MLQNEIKKPEFILQWKMSKSWFCLSLDRKKTISIAAGNDLGISVDYEELRAAL